MRNRRYEFQPRPAITGPSDDERALLVEALYALHHLGGREWLAACRIADEQGRRRLGQARMRLPELKRLARRLGSRASYWTER